MSKIRYYCSGWEKENAFPKELSVLLKKDIKSFHKIVFVPSNFNNKDKIERNSKCLINKFELSHLVFNNVVILDEHMSSQAMYNHIITANVVFLMGGNPTTQIEIIDSYFLKDAIKNTDAIVMGMSAGAMCMSKYSILLPINEKYPIMQIKKGLNLSGISIYPHYNSNGDFPEVLKNGTEETKKSDLLYATANYGTIYLLSDNSQIREKNGKLSFIGENIICLDTNSFKVISNQKYV